MISVLLRRSRPAIAGVALLLASLANTAAHAVFINITDASFTTESGYGIDASETSSPTLLDVRFATTVVLPLSFTLSSVGEFETFTFGTVNLQEPNTEQGIIAAETDSLGVTANFVFTSPLGSTEILSANATATTGSVSDAGVDYVLDWAPLLVNFGAGGIFEIYLNDLSFSGTGSQNQTGRITLLALPQTVITTVPEPLSLTLMSFGLVVLVLLIRRSRR